MLDWRKYSSKGNSSKPRRCPQTGEVDELEFRLEESELGNMSDNEIVELAESSKILKTFSCVTNRILQSKRKDPPGLRKTGSSEYGDKMQLSETDSSSDSSEEEKPRRYQQQDHEQFHVPVGELYEGHFQLFAHDKLWTLFGLLSSWLGFVFSHLARDSSSFVTLQIPLYIDPAFNVVTSIGMTKLTLCFNDTFIEKSGCIIDDLDSSEIDDNTFQLARSFAFLSLILGGFMSVMLSISVVWYSINLKPIGLGYLCAYFFQSFSFLFFDTSLCSSHGCNISNGGYFAIAASILWILACIAASRMDAIKYGQFDDKTGWQKTTSSLTSRASDDSCSLPNLDVQGMGDIETSFSQSFEAVEVGRKHVETALDCIRKQEKDRLNPVERSAGEARTGRTSLPQTGKVRMGDSGDLQSLKNIKGQKARSVELYRVRIVSE